jgi:cbb3-type cytochrome oxidase maturation protein
MSILYLLIPLAVVIMIVAIGFFLWTVRTGQYDDMEGPAHRILMDDDDPMIPKNARSAKRDRDQASSESDAQDRDS